ncbi:NUDIX domain-containing protein [Candidatus Berkelbacteria bacterium]|nr:NUDIX domain-containing protein [Candidatus Berkelbacteria bacterium]
MKFFVATKALIVQSEKVLILRESATYADGTNHGRYGLPGGRLEVGEQFEAALRREVSEETGLTVTIGRPIAVREWRPVVRDEEWQIVGIFFACASDSAAVTLSTEHDAFLWIDPHAHRSYGLIDNEHSVFDEYLAQRKL